MSNTAIVFPFFAWNVVTINTALLANNGYISNSGGTLQLQLPTVIFEGAEIRVSNYLGQWTVLLNAGQTIIFGNVTANTSLTSTSVGDSVELVCVIPNTIFLVTDCQGNITYF